MENIKTIDIKVEGKEWEEALDKAFVNANKKAKIDGFRPGKAPKEIFIKKYGEESLFMDAADIALQTAYVKVLEENKDLEIVAQPSVELKNVSKEALELTFKLILKPEFKLGDYKNLKVKKEKITVTDEEINASVEEMRNRYAEIAIKDGKVENGDTAVIDFEGFKDDVAFEGGKGENYPLELGSNSFIPGFEEQLVGTKAGDSLDVNVTFPKDYHAELASKAAVFKVTVHEVKTKVVPELTDDFVKELEIEGVNTVDEYKKHVQAELNEHAKAHSDEKYTNDLVEKACANTNVNIPECMIEDYAKDMKASSEKQAAQYNIPFEMYLQYMGYTLESFEKQAKEVAVKRIKADLVLSKIAEAEEIKVTPEELQAELKKLAEANSMELSEVQKRVNLNQLAINLEQSKVIDVLKANAVAPAKKTKKAE